MHWYYQIAFFTLFPFVYESYLGALDRYNFEVKKENHVKYWWELPWWAVPNSFLMGSLKAMVWPIAIFFNIFLIYLIYKCRKVKREK